MSVEEKLFQLGFNLPDAPTPLAAYVPSLKSGNLIFTAGQVPISDGKLLYKGKLGSEVSIEDGMKAAEVCALNCLSVIKKEAGSLDSIKRIVKVTVFVNSSDGFTDQPKVANGASELLVKLFEENGKHVRSAVGVNELPIDAAVEIEMIAEV
jgi:enamine deaminase RidA (YjgF/YER057c/UK114 family)